MNAHLGNAPDGIVISLSKKHAVFKKVGKDEPLPEGAKVSGSQSDVPNARRDAGGVQG